jgi:hypothetical protein
MGAKAVIGFWTAVFVALTVLGYLFYMPLFIICVTLVAIAAFLAVCVGAMALTIALANR